MTASEALQMIADMDLEDEDQITLVNVPPDDEVSDGDDLDEDATGPAEVSDVPGTLEVQVNCDVDEPEEGNSSTVGSDSTALEQRSSEEKKVHLCGDTCSPPTPVGMRRPMPPKVVLDRTSRTLWLGVHQLKYWKSC